MKAIAKGLRVPPRKMSMVAALVKGRSVEDSLVILDHTPRRAAGALKGIIKSAVANATNNDKKNQKALKVEQINVASGGMIKRMRIGGHTTVRPYRHRMSNVTVQLKEVKGQDSEEKKEKK